MVAHGENDLIARLRSNPRTDWVNGDRAEQITARPVFSENTRPIARLYDIQLMTASAGHGYEIAT
jgi:aromatic ring hydroxylase